MRVAPGSGSASGTRGLEDWGWGRIGVRVGVGLGLGVLHTYLVRVGVGVRVGARLRFRVRHILALRLDSAVGVRAPPGVELCQWVGPIGAAYGAHLDEA